MKVAILGFGIVGVGVYNMLDSVPDVEVAYVLVREGKEDGLCKVSNINKIISDESVECVIEVMGGVYPAYNYVREILKSGKSVVTSNKALVAEKGLELAELALNNEVAFLFSAACGGGVPFLHNISLAAESDEIVAIGGILNGTTNYILDLMQRNNISFSEALNKAKNLGYAENDPSADITGLDSLRKIMIACSVAFGVMPKNGLYNEGIEYFSADDALYIKSKGWTCRLIAEAKLENGILSAYVEPVLFSYYDQESTVLENYNILRYIGRNSGRIDMIGQGAGRYPTASAVTRDLSDIRVGRKYMIQKNTHYEDVDNSICVKKYLVRSRKEISFPIKPISRENMLDNIYYYFNDVAVSEMHHMVTKLRDEGNSLFFASIN